MKFTLGHLGRSCLLVALLAATHAQAVGNRTGNHINHTTAELQSFLLTDASPPVGDLHMDANDPEIEGYAFGTNRTNNSAADLPP